MTEQTQEKTEEKQEYARVELMGHRQRLGRIEAVQRFGVELLRIHSLDATGEPRIEDYAGSAIFSVTNVTREVVDAYEERNAQSRAEEAAWRARMNSRLLDSPSAEVDEWSFGDE